MNSIRKRLDDWKRIGWMAAGLAGLAFILWPGGFGAQGKAAVLASGPALESVLIRNVPHVCQKPDFCGEACAEMCLRKLGSALKQDDVFNAANIDPLLGRGCHTRELAKALQAIGFRTGPVWSEINASTARAGLSAAFAVVHADLLKGIPSIVCMRSNYGPDATEHFRLILGYNRETDSVIYHDPAVANGAYLRIPLHEFLDCWSLKYRVDRWTLIRLSMEPNRVSLEAAPKKGFAAADYVQHIMALRKKLPSKDFTVVIEPPFVVIGDGGLRAVQLHSERTVRWAVTRLKAAYFDKNPSSIIDIWLFNDAQSYEKHIRTIFNHEPTTPFGYSFPGEKALAMNIATGGGTLVHEIVHAFIDADFPACPAWFNEGLASLYEQSTANGDLIWGLTNWRLDGLQKAIKERRLPSFRRLTHTTRDQFYDDPTATNYAHARYLCYYLQEKGLLTRYYRQFKADHAKDPTGYETLKSILGEEDLAGFQKKWEQFVLALRFP